MAWLQERLRSDRGPTLQEFMDEFEISERTARRDIVFLRDQMNAPVE